MINERSSRSHCIVKIKGVNKIDNKIIKNEMAFIDLAGSERIYNSIKEINKIDIRVEEAKNINTSLSSLSRCIISLKSKNKHIPFKDSALTMLMKDFLYGNCATNLIVQISEDSNMINETISTLRFGSNCCYLKNNIAQNIVSNEDEVLNIKNEIFEYKNKLNNMKENGLAGGFNCDSTLKDTFINNFSKLK